MRKVHQHHIRAGGRPANVTPIVTHGGTGLQLAPGVNLPEQVTVALQEVALNARSGLLAFAVGVGLEVFHTILEENVSELVGQKGEDALGAGPRHHADLEQAVLDPVAAVPGVTGQEQHLLGVELHLARALE